MDRKLRWVTGEARATFSDVDEVPARPPSLETGSEPWPEWLSPIEAAYVTGLPLKVLVDRMADGSIEQVPSLDEHGGVLVRTSDVFAVAREPRPEPDRPAPRRRSDNFRTRAAVLSGALVVVFAAALWWTSRTPAPPGDTRPTAVTHPAAIAGTNPAEGDVAVEVPSPVDAVDPTPDPSSTGDVPASPVGLSIEPALFVISADRVAVATSIRNTTGRALPTSEVTFVVLDAAGHSLASAHTSVELAPGETAIVVADAIPLGPAASVARVDVTLDPVAFSAASPTGGNLTVQGAVATWDRVAGEIVNPGTYRRSVRIDCMFIREGGKLAGVVSSDFGPVRPNGTTPFTVPVAHAVRPVGTATCSAT